MKLSKATPEDQKLWDDFVLNNRGSVYHLFSWSKIFWNALGYEDEYLINANHSKVNLIFPLVKRGNFKTELSSLPFTDCAGPLVKESPDFKMCLEYLKNQSEPYEIYSTFRSDKNYDNEAFSLFELKLPEKYSEVFEKFYHHKTRNIVRKTEKNNVTTSICKTIGQDEVSQFYSLYTKTMKKIGTISLPLIFFQETSRNLGQHSIMVKAEYQKKMASLLWCFTFSNCLYVWANGTEEKLLGSGANYAVYDEAIKYAIECGKEKIILGVSEKDSPQSFFKLRWGAKPIPVYRYTNDNTSTERKKILDYAKLIFKILPMPIYLLICQLIFIFF